MIIGFSRLDSASTLILLNIPSPNPPFFVFVGAHFLPLPIGRRLNDGERFVEF